MLTKDIREVNRLEKNANRMEKIVALIEMVQKTNEVSGLDLEFIKQKSIIAKNAMIDIRKKMMN